jgi:hypothetical protein
MSLDWNVSGCKNDEEIWMSTEVEGPITEAIVWSSLVVKLGNITEKNWSEWYARYEIWNRVMCFDNNLEPKDFHRRIGLSTNVHPAESRSKWLNGAIKNELQRKANHGIWEMEQLLKEEIVDV